ncbi:MAG TPA: hypothetical protein VFS00_22900, partial [Polyangiaceae bacterium]|nr:hypothetical protein [Polyangiaceae bacterium]
MTSLAAWAPAALVACSLSEGTEDLKQDGGSAGAAGKAGGGGGGQAGQANGGSGGSGASSGAGGSGGGGVGGAGAGGAGTGGVGGGAGQSGAAGTAGAAPRTYAELVLAEEPVAYYRFDDDPQAGKAVSTVAGGPEGVVQGDRLERVAGALVGDASAAARFVNSSVLLGN